MVMFQEAESLAWIYEIGTIIGIGLFVFSFYLIIKIKQLFPGGKIVKKWTIMQIILIILIIVYIIDWIVWIYDVRLALFILGGIIRLSIGIFILLVINLIYSTYNLILHKEKEN